ncbi:MAG: hypothetical protein SGBAC_005844, partial [Bacillariaceae sp.]
MNKLPTTNETEVVTTQDVESDSSLSNDGNEAALKPTNESVETHKDEESDGSLSTNNEATAWKKPTTLSLMITQDPCFRYAKQFLGAFGKAMGIACVVSISLILIFTLSEPSSATAANSNNSAAAASTESGGASSTMITAPTPAATQPPSMAPLPTQEPSMIPTWEPAVSSSFQIRLYWEEGYYWQEDRDEMFYCMECADCDEYSTGDGDDADCRSRGSSSARCREGHLIWVEWCNRRDYQFEIIQHYDSSNQVRVHGTDLCFSTVRNRYLELRPCQKSDALQLWSPIADTKRFELRPFDQRNWTRDEARCLSQQHHPKSEELVALHSCAEARQDETVYWT